MEFWKQWKECFAWNNCETASVPCQPSLIAHSRTLRRGNHSTRHDDATNDPADWNRSSQESHPIDLLEPETSTPNPYREAGILFLSLIEKIDSEMARSRDARKTWVAVSISLGLHSTSGVTVTQAAAQLGITKQALSRTVASFSRMTGFQPAAGLKSIESRQTYRRCH